MNYFLVTLVKRGGSQPRSAAHYTSPPLEKNEKGEVTRGGGKGEGPEGACKRRGMVEGSRERKGEGSGEGLVDG